MAALILVRHAQASFFGPSYDCLSPLGRDQARCLGEHWARAGLALERVYVGPRARHRETCELVGRAFASHGSAWPDPEPCALLDEHHGVAVLKHVLGQGTGDALHPGEALEAERDTIRRRFFRDYLAVMRDWIHGRVGAPDVESWAAFQARAARALDELCRADATGVSVAFTSGGLVCAATGVLLGLDADRVIDLSLVLRNTALTEVSHAAGRRRLLSFNGIPHLTDPAHATAV